jgi:hypothetical protein
LLREGGSDVCETDRNGMSALLHAAMHGHLSVVQFLQQEGGCRADEADKEGKTPLLHASFNGHLPVVKYLLHEGGSRISEQDVHGRTALLHAVRHGHLPVVRYLVVEAGASVADRDAEGRTPLLITAYFGHLSVCQYLLREGGSRMEEKSTDGSTVWSMRAKHCQSGARVSPTALADVFSVLRCFRSPSPGWIGSLWMEDEDGYLKPLPTAHRELLQRTERAHAHPCLLKYRMRRLDLLGWDSQSDCARLLYPDLQNIVMEYLFDSVLAYLPDAAMLAEAVIAEAEAAEEYRKTGRLPSLQSA